MLGFLRRSIPNEVGGRGDLRIRTRVSSPLHALQHMGGSSGKIGAGSPSSPSSARMMRRFLIRVSILIRRGAITANRIAERTGALDQPPVP